MSKANASYVWTPRDLATIAASDLTKTAWRVYALATRYADRRTGRFVITKIRAASEIGACKRATDQGFARLVALGILTRAPVIRNGRQRANAWALMPRHLWRLAAHHARHAYGQMMAAMHRQRVARRERLQLLDGAGKVHAVSQQTDLTGSSEADIAQVVARRANQQGYGLDYDRQTREIAQLVARYRPKEA